LHCGGLWVGVEQQDLFGALRSLYGERDRE